MVRVRDRPPHGPCDYAESLQPFDEMKHHHTLEEVGDVADGRYDWKTGRSRREISSLIVMCISAVYRILHSIHIKTFCPVIFFYVFQYKSSFLIKLVCYLRCSYRNAFNSHRI